MTRKYTKRNTAYWSSKGKVKVTVNRKSSTIMHDKGKHVSVKIVSQKGKPFYNRKSV